MKWNEVGERIKKIRSENSLGLTEFGKLVGKNKKNKTNISHVTIRNWENGSQIKKENWDALIKTIIKINPLKTEHWLQTGDQTIKINENSPEYNTEYNTETSEFKNTGSIQSNYKAIPIVGMAQLGDNGYFEDQQHPAGQGDGHIDTPTQDKDAYALKVVGDSMHPAIRHGWYVVIEPNLEPFNGMIALFQLKDGRKMIKELSNTADGYYTLLSINQEHKRITVSASEIDKIHPVAFIAPPNKVKHP
jgi:phage repressor protein C with HTH and peptisase S24 domain